MSQSNYSLALPELSTHPLPTTTYPPPPSTTHTLSEKDRTRLVKSTRKLSTVLGSTPHIASAPAAPDPLSIPPFTRNKEPPTPRTKKSRRGGRVFTPTSMPTNFSAYNSSNTSLSSFDSEVEDGEVEKDGYVVVRRGGATGYHYHHLDISLPVNHKSEAIKVTLAPSASDRKSKKGGKALPPLLLLRLRAVPIDNRRDSIISTTTSIKSPLSPSFPPSSSHTASQKVKKLNKLSRTFGEPVPHELVFPQAVRTPSPELLKKVEEKPQGPRLSARERKARREGKKRAVEPLPPTPPASSSKYPRSEGVYVTQSRTRSGSLAQTSRRAARPRSLTLLPPLTPHPPSLPLPVPPAEDSSSEEECDTPPTSSDDLPESLKVHLSSSSSPRAAAPMSPRHAYSQSTPNLPRPRTSSSGASQKSEDKTHHRIPISYTTHTRSKTLDNRSSMAFHGVTSSDKHRVAGDEEEEYGHRREREWSGEWNVNVGEVRRLLRELKAH